MTRSFLRRPRERRTSVCHGDAATGRGGVSRQNRQGRDDRPENFADASRTAIRFAARRRRAFDGGGFVFAFHVNSNDVRSVHEIGKGVQEFGNA